ncbi:type II toxin-antitoxin system RelE/ParE family toxin [Breoghania sp. L-A4]|uniref:type II toxin-antitoxin system RelE/ParE family toxin n=1 Tax=Breoghania sp. L-A4 TaxID=2304600 RepID=UPI000E3609BE|nr:type II toxin-antitoxin system RelE/ParE family toxin [Breoghania sp. L-A4]AXS41625.1 addiction module toxin RelE [Breoghania sp. L-A4]
MAWTINFHDSFADEFDRLAEDVKIELMAMVILLAEFGPQLSRPHADTLKGSRHANMKELRFRADNGAWRVAYAFDPERKAILLVAGDKSGVSEKRFYKQLLATADQRLGDHLARLKGQTP